MLIRRFIAPYYKGYLSLAVTFNILSALLNLVAFALVMPILNILFQIEDRVTTYIPFSTLDLTTQAGWSQLKGVMTNNFGYAVSQLIETKGASYTLIMRRSWLYPWASSVKSVRGTCWHVSRATSVRWRTR